MSMADSSSLEEYSQITGPASSSAANSRSLTAASGTTPHGKNSTETYLFKAIECREWKSAIARVLHTPTEASKWVQHYHHTKNRPSSSSSHQEGIAKKLLPIHYACAQHPPVVMIDRLLSAYPAGVKSRDANGNLPIHYATKFGASVSVIETLLESYPESLEEMDGDGLTPLVIAVNSRFPGKDKIVDALSKNTRQYTTNKPVVKVERNGNDANGDMKLSKSLSEMDFVVESYDDRDRVKRLPADSYNDDDDGINWKKSGVVITIMGASGHLALTKTYPALLYLYANHLLPDDTILWGYARSEFKNESFRAQLKSFLMQDDNSYKDKIVDKFLSKCYYQKGISYTDEDSFQIMVDRIASHENNFTYKAAHHRLFYMALPHAIQCEAASTIEKIGMSTKGWTRVIVEKPFGYDISSAEKILSDLKLYFDEESIYRIDHNIGKDMVENLLVFRFSNLWIEKLWNRNDIQCIIISHKVSQDINPKVQPYSDKKYGIITDVIQNHLMQILALVAMESPIKLDGPEASEKIRNGKSNVLSAIPPISIDDCFLGQYKGNTNKNVPTYALLRCFIRTPRWDGVPFILQAGHGLDEPSSQIRIQFRSSPGSDFLLDSKCPRNELVMNLQPHGGFSIKTNVKTPGFCFEPTPVNLPLNYDTRIFYKDKEINPNSYCRLILDVIRGQQAAFARDDEIKRCWEITTPLLQKITDKNQQPKIWVYEKGSTGPDGVEDWIAKRSGYMKHEDKVFYNASTKALPLSTKESGKTTASTPNKPKPRPSGDCDVGLYGLSILGQNFALNMASHGFKVCVTHSRQSKVNITLNRAQEEGNLPLLGARTPQEFISNLKTPRVVILIGMSSKPTEGTIAVLSKYMEPGDILVDTGSEWYSTAMRRGHELAKKEIIFMGMAFSGGEDGARDGPCLMLGGPIQGYNRLEPIVTTCAAQFEDESCAGYIGPIGSENYVKMVQSGIEYGEMQLIAEVYDVMNTVLTMTNEAMSQVFVQWNDQGELSSHLTEMTSIILAKKDGLTGEGYVIDKILDKISMKGSGRLTVQEAAEQSVPVPSISAALDARHIGSKKYERVKMSEFFNDPELTEENVDKEQVLNDLKAAYYASKICIYAQAFALIKTASDSKSWGVDLSLCARLWKGGCCVIRGNILDKVQSTFTADPNLFNIMIDSGFASDLNQRLEGWRRLLKITIDYGITSPTMSASLTYFDAFRRIRLPSNLIQAQRNFIGGHSFERNDRSGVFHCAWTEAHKKGGKRGNKAVRRMSH